MVALAIIGAGFEGFSIPLLAAVGTGTSLSEEFDGADTEGERDEAPEDLNELAWFLVPFASRGEKGRYQGEAPEFLPVAKLGSKRAACLLPASPWANACPTPIRLCRFMC